MVKRLGEVLFIVCLAIAAFLLWAAFHQTNGVNVPVNTALFISAIPASIGAMLYYVLAVRT